MGDLTHVEVTYFVWQINWSLEAQAYFSQASLRLQTMRQTLYEKQVTIGLGEANQLCEGMGGVATKQS